MQRIVITFILWASTALSVTALGKTQEKKSDSDESHSIEVEAVLTNGLVYRYRHGDQNFSVGLGMHNKPDKLDGLVNYQTYVLGIPIDGILYRWSRERGEKSSDDFGSLRVTSLAYYVGVGTWFKPKIYGAFYLPISFGLDYPVFKQSRFESDATEDFSTNDRKKISVYFRLGGGYEF